MMRWAALLLIVSALSFGCRLQMAGKWGGAAGAYSGSIADVRISQGLATVDDEGVQTAMDKHAASPEFLSMIQDTAPEVVDVLAKALLTKGASSVFGALSGLIDEDEVLDEIEGEMEEELFESEKTPGPRRTEAEKAANRAKRSEERRGNVPSD